MGIIIEQVERATAFDNGKGVKTKRVITILDDIPDNEVEAALHTGNKEPPKLLTIHREGQITGIFVVGDGVHISCKDNMVTDAVIACFDLDYPTTDSQIVGILQTHVIGGVPFEGKNTEGQIPNIY
ncbi:uncharacterized protein [Asterias amurensis]|uniref:uncharacterized protein n=1 Tax=Asterias amurensis TaxID=7602 RepID=UPI003AB50886